MGDIAPKIRLSPEDYLAFERAAEERHEYVRGEIVVMPPTSFEHSGTAVGIVCELRTALRDRRWAVFPCNMRVHIPATVGYVYPDASVVCEPRLLQDDKRDNLLNPRLVVEVLSDSSEAYDRGDKFAQYRTISSLRTYVLASQKEPRIEVFSRQPDDSWVLRVYGPGEHAALADLDVALDVDRIYDDVLQSPASAGTPPV